MEDQRIRTGYADDKDRVGNQHQKDQELLS